MTESTGIPIDLRLVLTFVGVLIPVCVWFSRYLTKTHKKIHKRLDAIEGLHKRLDVIEEQVLKIHVRLDNIEYESIERLARGRRCK